MRRKQAIVSLAPLVIGPSCGFVSQPGPSQHRQVDQSQRQNIKNNDATSCSKPEFASATKKFQWQLKDSLFDDIFESRGSSGQGSSFYENDEDWPQSFYNEGRILPPENYNDDAPPFSEHESMADRTRRMEMVRELQKSYYSASSSFDSSSAPSNPFSSPSSSSPSTATAFFSSFSSVLSRGSSGTSTNSESKTLNQNNPITNALPYGSSNLRNLPTLTSRDYISSSANSESSPSANVDHVVNDTSPYNTAILPGYQFLWSVDEPQHCHMFHSILSQSPPWYFVHVYIPEEGSSDGVNGYADGNNVGENVNNNIDKLQASYDYIKNHLSCSSSPYPTNPSFNYTQPYTTSNPYSQSPSPQPLYGTLLRITDRRFQDHDGKIVLAVQAMDRVRIDRLSSQPHLTPYLMTDVELFPEEEMVKQYFDRAMMTSALYYQSSSDSGLSQHGSNDGAMGAMDDFHNDYDDGIEEEGIAENSFMADPTAVAGAARAAAVAESSRCRKFEYLPLFLEEIPKRPPSTHVRNDSANSNSGDGSNSNGKDDLEVEYNNIVQLINFDALAYSTLEDANAVITQALKTYWTEYGRQEAAPDEDFLLDGDPFPAHSSSLSSSSSPFSSTTGSVTTYSLEAIEMLEYHLWRSLDEMIRLLSLASPTPVPLPSQLLGLLPKRKDWPREFVLENYANSLSLATGGGGGGMSGSFANSPFVRLDEVTRKSKDVASQSSQSATTSINADANPALSPYSTLRRAQRISYAIWLLLDGLAMTGAQPPPPPRHAILGMSSVGDRIKSATQTLEGINGILRRLIPENRKE